MGLRFLDDPETHRSWLARGGWLAWPGRWVLCGSPGGPGQPGLAGPAQSSGRTGAQLGSAPAWRLGLLSRQGPVHQRADWLVGGSTNRTRPGLGGSSPPFSTDSASPAKRPAELAWPTRLAGLASSGDRLAQRAWQGWLVDSNRPGRLGKVGSCGEKPCGATRSGRHGVCGSMTLSGPGNTSRSRPSG